MRMLPLVLIGPVAFGLVLAQDTPVVVSKPRYTAEVGRQRVQNTYLRQSGRAETPITCSLADNTSHRVTTAVALRGKTYRCVWVLDEKLKPVGAAWTPVEDQR